MKLYIGADHRGYKLKEKLFAWLVAEGYLVEDFGAYEFNKVDDYTEFAEKVASVVGNHYVERERPTHQEEGEVFGILVCGSGVGVSVTANKFDGVRAAIGKESGQIKAGREDDNMNILIVAADFTTTSEAKKMLKTFLTSKFKGEERHVRRLSDIERIEANN